MAYDRTDQDTPLPQQHTTGEIRARLLLSNTQQENAHYRAHLLPSNAKLTKTGRTSKEWDADAHKCCEDHKRAANNDSGEQLVADTLLDAEGFTHVKDRHGVHLQHTKRTVSQHQSGNKFGKHLQHSRNVQTWQWVITQNHNHEADSYEAMPCYDDLTRAIQPFTFTTYTKHIPIGL